MAIRMDSPGVVAPRFSPELRRVVVVIALGAIMSMLDSTIVNVALRTLSVRLHTSLVSVQWVVTAYLLALAAVIPVTGWAARRVGARRLYAGALAAFTAASLLCGLARSPGQLIACRAVQGLAGGLTGPVGQMILVRKAGPANMSRVIATVGIPMIMAPVIGPTVGGLLLDHAGWRWIFLVNVPVGLVAVALALRLLPADAAEDAGRLDVLGLVLAAGGTVLLTYGLAEVGAEVATSPKVLGGLIGGLLLLAAFVVRALRSPRPLLDMRLYRHPVFGAAALTTFAYGAAIFGGMILLPLYFQQVRHEDAVTTGLLLGPSGLGAAVAMWLSARMVDRFGAGRTSLIGGAVSLVTTVPFMVLNAHTSYALLTAGLLARGFGIGLSAMPAMTVAYQVLGPAQINDATPQLSVVQRVGGSVGTALFAVVLQHALTGAHDPAAQAGAYATTFWWVFATTLVAVLPTILLTHAERRLSHRQ